MSDINNMNVGIRWYVAHTYAGYENKVKDSLENIIENRHLEDLIFDIKIPVEKVVTEKKKRRSKNASADGETNDGEVEQVVEEIKIFPSYVFVKMIMTEESWHAVRNITGVTGFVGPGSRPQPLTDKEVTDLQIEEAKITYTIGVGDTVRINEGLFRGCECKVQRVSDDFKTLTVLVARGARMMPVEIASSQVEKIG
jgi:transcriptional antiterminator NusG